MTVPNYITLLRIILIPFFVDFMIYGYYREALVVFGAACITDALDGSLARILNQKSELGAFLDPMADKLLILAAFLTLSYLGALPVWLVILVVSRDVILTMGGLAIYFTNGTLRIQPSRIGKLTTVLQLAVVVVSLLFITYEIQTVFVNALLWTTAGITVGSGMQYVFKGIKMAG